VALARADLEGGRAADALRRLDDAAAMLLAKPDRLLEANVRFHTARALRALRRDPARARALMTQAREVYATLPAEKESLADAERFLAASR
jgi:hypothetical protein